jgi:hypothetical protein
MSYEDRWIRPVIDDVRSRMVGKTIDSVEFAVDADGIDSMTLTFTDDASIEIGQHDIEGFGVLTFEGRG